MKFPEEQIQRDSLEIDHLLKDVSVLSLVTCHEEKLQMGLYNFLYEDASFYIHLGRKDEQCEALRRNRRALIAVQDVLSVIPSFWIDEEYGGAINNFFRYVEFDCEAEIVDEPRLLLPILQKMLDVYQTERWYAPLDTESPIYYEKFRMLSVVKFKVLSMRTKWNLGQKKQREAYLNVIEKLKERATPTDQKTALEMEKWPFKH